jgi:hypothetical protein
MAGGGAGTGGGCRLLACALAAVLASGLTGCRADPPAPAAELPVRTAAEPTPTLEPAEAEAVSEILAVFDRYRRAETGIIADPVEPGEARHRLTDHLADPLLTLVVFELDLLRRLGVAGAGRPTWDPTVTGLRLDGPVPTATVHDCLDTTGTRLVEPLTGDPAAADGLPGRFAPGRHGREFHAVRHGGGWLLDDRADRAEPC